MRSLSKVIALVLAMVLAFGMLSAGAANFTDSEDVAATEAVAMLTTLGVIKGYPDDTFRPDRVVTRAEMAKMIFTIRNGGNSDDYIYTGMSTPFEDVKNHWAKGYINYCYALGIVNGKSPAYFDPDAPLTGLEAAKMALVCLGYNAEKAGLTGFGWDQKAAALGIDAGLFRDFGVSATAGTPRQFAAQLLYNALFADTVMLVNGVYETTSSATGEKFGTLGSKFLSLNVYEGILLSSGSYGVQANVPAACAAAPAKDKLQVAVQRVNSNAKKALYALDAGDSKTFDCETDYSDLIGQYVKAITGKNGRLFGVYAVAGENRVVTSVLGKVRPVDYNTVEIDGTDYDFAPGALRYNGETSTGSFAFASEPGDASSVTFIDNTGDGRFDIALVRPIESVNRVTFVSSTGFFAGASYSFEDVLCYEGIAKDDYAVRVKDYFSDKDKFIKAELISGRVDAVRGAMTDVRVGGNWYRVSETPAMTGDALALGSSYTLAVYQGFVFNAKLDAAGYRDLAVVTGQAGSRGLSGWYETNLLLADGTVKTVECPQGKSDGINIGDFVIYKLESNGSYTLTHLSDADIKTRLGYDAYDNKYTSFDSVKRALKADDGTYKMVADTAVVFVRYDKDGAGPETAMGNKVMTGADLNNLSSSYPAAIEVLYNNAGFADAQVVYLCGAKGVPLPGVTVLKTAGYVLSTPYTASDGGIIYTVYDVWTANGSMTVKQKGTANLPSRGDFIAFDIVKDSFVENVTAGVNPVAITGFDASRGIIGINGTTYALKDDVRYLYVDSENYRGITGGEVSTALEPETGVFYENAKVIIDAADGKVRYIAVDSVKNRWHGAGVAGSFAGVAAITAQFAAVNSVTVTSPFTIDADFTVPAGRTLIFNGATTVAAGRKLTVNGVVTVNNNLTAAGTVDINGTLNVGGTVANPANITVKAVGTVGLSGTVAKADEIEKEPGARMVITGTGVSTASAAAFYTAAGDVDTAGAAVAVGAVPAGSYSYTTNNVYTDNAGTKGSAWLKA